MPALQIIGAPLVALDTIDSTNVHAKSLAAQGAPEGTVVSAEEQTAGKGRLGRIWNSAKGQNLTFSIILRPRIVPEKLGLISLMAAVALADALWDDGFAAETKWPNDIYLAGRKVCGMLSESVFTGSALSAVVVGIGLNVNQMVFPPEIESTATSLAISRGVQIDRNQLFKKVLASLDRWYALLAEEQYAGIISGWKEYCGMLGKEITLVSATAERKGIALDIADDGSLLFRSGNQVERVYAGDVSIKK